MSTFFVSLYVHAMHTNKATVIKQQRAVAKGTELIGAALYHVITVMANHICYIEEPTRSSHNRREGGINKYINCNK